MTEEEYTEKHLERIKELDPVELDILDGFVVTLAVVGARMIANDPDLVREMWPLVLSHDYEELVTDMLKSEEMADAIKKGYFK